MNGHNDAVNGNDNSENSDDDVPTTKDRTSSTVHGNAGTAADPPADRGRRETSDVARPSRNTSRPTSRVNKRPPRSSGPGPGVAGQGNVLAGLPVEFFSGIVDAIEQNRHDKRKLFDAVKELERFNDKTTREVEALRIRNKELETIAKIERERRLEADRAAQAAAQADRRAAHCRDKHGDFERIQTNLGHARTEIDTLHALLREAEQERDAALRRLTIGDPAPESRTGSAARSTGDRSPAGGGLASGEPASASGPASGLTSRLGAAENFADLFTRMEHASPLVICTADPQFARVLDDHPRAPAWCRRAVDAVDTLIAYAIARADSRNHSRRAGPHLADLRTFVRAGGPHVRITARSIALDEMLVAGTPRFAERRTFRVPHDVHPDGKASMYAHIRIGGSKPPAPRLHFLDDTNKSGLIVIGYLGPHLPTSKTN